MKNLVLIVLTSIACSTAFTVAPASAAAPTVSQELFFRLTGDAAKLVQRYHQWQADRLAVEVARTEITVLKRVKASAAEVTKSTVREADALAERAKK